VSTISTGERVRTRRGGRGTVLDTSAPARNPDEQLVLVAFDNGRTLAVRACTVLPLPKERHS